MAADEAGAVFGVGRVQVFRALRVLREGCKQLIEQCERGEVAVSLACRLLDACETPKEQTTVAKGGKSGIRERLQNGQSPAWVAQAEAEAAASVARTLTERGQDLDVDHHDDADNGPGHKARGVGVLRAHEAINALQRIPPRDPLRHRAYEMVCDWIAARRQDGF
jgi:hypothetical protein